MKELSPNHRTAREFPKIIYFQIGQKTSFLILSLGQWGMLNVVILKRWTQAITSKSSHSVCFPDPPTVPGCQLIWAPSPSALSLGKGPSGPGLSPHPFAQASTQYTVCWLGISAAGPAGTLHSSQPNRPLDGPQSPLPLLPPPSKLVIP